MKCDRGKYQIIDKNKKQSNKIFLTFKLFDY